MYEKLTPYLMWIKEPWNHLFRWSKCDEGKLISRFSRNNVIFYSLISKSFIFPKITPRTTKFKSSFVREKKNGAGDTTFPVCRVTNWLQNSNSTWKNKFTRTCGFFVIFIMESLTTKHEKYQFFNTLLCLAKSLENRCTTIDLRNETSVTGKITQVDG